MGAQHGPDKTIVVLILEDFSHVVIDAGTHTVIG